MNILKHFAICALLFCGAQQAAAQAHEGRALPRLFSDLPDSFVVHQTTLNALLEKDVHTTARMEIAPQFVLQGNIVSTAQQGQPAFNSVVLKSSNRLGAVLTLARMTESSGKVVYTGRILSRGHADAYELVEGENGYLLVKRAYADLTEE